ncbi:MAG: ABC transporter permease subunit [Agriterribacter sp.]
MIIKTVFQYEWKLFRRNKAMLAALSVMLLVGLYAIYYAHSFNATQLRTIYTLDTACQNRMQTQVNNFAADTSTKEGKDKYKHAHDPFMNEWFMRSMIWKTPEPLQALSIGQSDNQPFFFGLWVYNDNIYTSKKIELRNPDKLQAGNFDLAFVIIYLFPLLIIAFNYSVYSNDMERGTYALLRAHGISLNRIISGRLLFRLAFVEGLNILLTVLAFAANDIFSIALFSAWLFISSMYIFFWFSLAYLIVMFRKSSTLSALLLISSWIALLLVIPPIFNDAQKEHDAERIELSDADREYSIHLWDLWQSKSPHLFDTLYIIEPQWKQYAVKDSEEMRSVAYSYLDIVHLNQKGWEADSLLLVRQHQQLTYRLLNPAYTAQYALNQLAGTETDKFIQFRKSAAAYHRQRAGYLAALRIPAKPFTMQELKGYPVFKQPALSPTFRQVPELAYPLVILMLVCWIAAIILRNPKSD